LEELCAFDQQSVAAIFIEDAIRIATNGVKRIKSDRLLDCNERKHPPMLVTFSTKAAADITMFGDVAITLLKLMGQSGALPGALLAPDLPEAIDRLKKGVAAAGNEPAGNPPRRADEDEEKAPPPVTLRQRAFPLIKLLEAAAHAEADVVWGETRNPLL
jgi:hypothetical protein